MPNQKQLKELLHYNPATGMFTWMVSRRCVKAGGVAGNSASNTSGVKGVGRHKASEKWRAYIQVNGKLIHLGLHEDLMEAVCHRLAAEQLENWHGCDSSSPAYKYVKKFTRVF